MMKHRSNSGFTMVELMVTIVAATIVTIAASTVLLFGLRMNRISTETASKQNTANIVLTVLGDLVAEENIDLSENPAQNTVEHNTVNWTVNKVVEDSGSKTVEPLFCYKAENKAIYLGNSADSPIMTDVIASASLSNNNVLTLEIITQDGETYTSSVYCRMNPPVAGSNGVNLIRTFSEEAIDPTPDFTSVSHPEGRQAFLDILRAEEGSTGCSLTTGEYFSEWYVGGYHNNPSWNEQTPWCACFVSWALDQCGEYLNEVPKFAHVDKFMYSFGRVRWKTENPDPGDIIFFDWIENQASYPQHVGVVLTVTDGIVCTIEGNTDGMVAVRQYPADDPHILGYGVLNWK